MAMTKAASRWRADQHTTYHNLQPRKAKWVIPDDNPAGSPKLKEFNQTENSHRQAPEPEPYRSDPGPRDPPDAPEKTPKPLNP